VDFKTPCINFGIIRVTNCRDNVVLVHDTKTYTGGGGERLVSSNLNHDSRGS
jgi:hypothetical protein